MSPKDLAYRRVGHCLWALLAATLGGLLGRFSFGASRRRAEEEGAAARPEGQELGRWPRRPVEVGLSALVAVAALGLVALWRASDVWAGATFLTTCAALGLAALGALSSRGRRRAVWLGAALFGWGYLAMVFYRPKEDLFNWGPVAVEPPSLITTRLLEAVRSRLPAILKRRPAPSDGHLAANTRILAELERPIPMHFPDEAALEDVLTSIKAATAGPGYPGIPIYVDPLGLQEAEKSMTTTVTLDLEGVPLKTTLGLMLGQLGLTYTVKDGLLLIYNPNGDTILPVYDLVLLVGHCLLALLSAGLGGALAPLVEERITPA
jgi:hypothetical protein